MDVQFTHGMLQQFVTIIESQQLEKLAQWLFRSIWDSLCLMLPVIGFLVH